MKKYLLASLLILPIWPHQASAHHFKGLPHFSYFENYPQVPQDEFLGQVGDYEFSLVLYDFQGIKREDAQQPDNARFYLVIYNLRENKAYQGPLTLEILDRDRVVHKEHFKSSHEESLYSMQKKLSDSGKYSMAITIHDQDHLKSILPFLLSSQKVHWGKWLIGLLFVFILVVAIGSRRARVAMDRRSNAQLRMHKEVTG